LYAALNPRKVVSYVCGAAFSFSPSDRLIGFTAALKALHHPKAGASPVCLKAYPDTNRTSRNSVCVLGGFDYGYGAGGPEVVCFASKALGVELIVFGIELKGDVGLFFVGHHQIQVVAGRASHEGGLARI
jgi:hypothetical protein